MTKNNTNWPLLRPQAEAAVQLLDERFDPIEASLREWAPSSSGDDQSRLELTSKLSAPEGLEEDKDSFDRGKYLHPFEAGHPKEMGISYSRTRRLETMAERQEKMERERKSRTG